MTPFWTPPSLRRLALDPRVGPRAIRVYAFVVADLDFEQYRPVKLLPVARALRLKRQNASRALQILVEGGYLDRNGRAWPGGPFQYRIPPVIDEGPLAATPRLA